MDPDLICPCCSGKKYCDCCRIYHQGKLPKTAQALMQSRYSAYALNNIDYIVRTTHPRNSAFAQNLEAWRQEIFNFALHTDFEKLEILDAKEGKEKATVVFIAHLKSQGEDVTFTEKSYFAKVDGKWLYVNGDLFSGENREVRA
jgi:SEC-C motif-containing protein